MRSRKAWLAAMAAALGVSDAQCKKEETNAPAALREVPSASASAPVVAMSAPSETASVAPIASASAAPSTSATSPPTISSADLERMGALFGTLRSDAGNAIGVGSIGNLGRHVNPACGAVAERPEPTPTVSVQMLTGSSDDNAKIQTTLRPRLRNCANAATSRDPNARGSATLQLSIDAHGNVASVDAQPTSGALGETTLACMKSAARGVKFGDGGTRVIRVELRVERNY